ncbi:MAG: hypothetical protein RBT73_01460 [Spirochaetia bacterium]|jgi:hypothetical protein|nr:hypothetical protein [Spirochaetia bacterium]
MKTVFTSTFQDEALVVLSILRSGGIEGELMANSMLNVNPLFVTDIRGVSVVVSDDQEADALALVSDYRSKSARGN